MLYKKGKSDFIMYKIEFDEAYDSVDWIFFLNRSSRIWISNFNNQAIYELHHFIIQFLKQVDEMKYDMTK